MNFFTKLKGDNAPLPAPPPAQHLIIAGTGSLLAISLIALASTALNNTLSAPLLLASFGASCLLVFGYPDAPFSQPRNVVAGHFTGTLIGLVYTTALGAHWWSLALAIAATMVVMMLFRIVHPPAASNPLIIYGASSVTWKFLVFPTLAGALVLVAIALVFNNLTREAKYPKYW